MIDDQKIKLEINGHDRFSERDKEYFTLTQPFNHHTSIPGYNIKEMEELLKTVNPNVNNEKGQTALTLAAGKIACRFSFF